jgi:hypothetical protein
VTTYLSNVQRWLAAIVLSLAVPAAVLAPVTVLAATIRTDRTIVYSTSMHGLNDSISVPVSGSLHIKVNKDGILSGYYSPDYATEFTPVTGGVNGDRVWLQIGAYAPTRVQGTYQNGTITGTAYSPDHHIYAFAATNAKVDQNS